MTIPIISPGPGRLTVDLDALARNFHKLSAAGAPGECAAVIKANAYGLGVGPVARRLFEEGCRRFFVASSGEGAELRGFLPESDIYVFEGAPPNGEDALLRARLTPVLNSIEQITRWRTVARSTRCVVHIDTGMSRLGLSAGEVEHVAAESLLNDLDVEYVLTHLACADDPSHPLTGEQIERFDALRAKLPEAKTSIGSSPGIMLDASSRGDLVRPGIALYGGNPFVSGDNPMEVVVTVEGLILQVREVTEPLTVGYGASYTANSPARLATVGTGYADGYPRTLGNCGVAFLAGRKVPVVGRVSMDLITLDVSAVPPECVQAGKFVELVGPNVPLDDVARAAGTISYEILTGLGRRWERRYVPNDTEP